MAGESERWAFHINIDIFFYFSPHDLEQESSKNIRCEQRKPVCSPPSGARVYPNTPTALSEGLFFTKSMNALYNALDIPSNLYVNALYFHLMIKENTGWAERRAIMLLNWNVKYKYTFLYHVEYTVFLQKCNLSSDFI